jgi:hypothetical protein
MQIINRISFDLIMTTFSGSITIIPKWFTRRLLPLKNTFIEGTTTGLNNHPMSETGYDYLDAILSVRRAGTVHP